MRENPDSDYLEVDRYRLSPQQRSVWAERQSGSPPLAKLAIAIEGKLSTDRLATAINQVVGRNEILRTRFERVPEFKFPFQVIESVARIYSESRSGADLSQIPAIAATIFAQHQHLYSQDDTRYDLLWTLFRGSNRALLCVSLSSLCVDSRSLCSIFEELAAAYQSAEGACAADVIQYADYSEYKNQMNSGRNERKDFAESFLRSHYESCPEPIQLPFECHSSSDGTRTWLHFKAEDELVRQLEALAATKRASLPDVIAVAWILLISRMACRDEAAILACFSGRTLPELNLAVGRFENWIPLWFSLRQDRTFADLLRDAACQRAQLDEHQDYFRYDADYVARFRDSRELVAFDYLENQTRVISGSSAWSIADLECQAEYAKLTLNGFKTGGGLALRVGFVPTIFNRATAEVLPLRLLTLLESVAGSPEKPVGALNVLPENEWPVAASESTWVAQKMPLITDLIAKQVDRFGDRLALVCGRTQLSYSKLNGLAERVAGQLRQAGAGNESIVALLFDRSAEAVVGLLATLKAGAAYVMLDPKAPAARLQIYLHSLRPACVLTRKEYLPILDQAAGFGPAVDVLILDDAVACKGALQSERPDPESLAYVIQTSGSTGSPKNVAVTHHGLSSYVLALCQALGIDMAGDRPLNFAMVSAFTADLGNTAIYAALASGGCLHVLLDETRIDAKAFSAYIKEQAIDVLKIVPSHMQALLAIDEALAPPCHMIVLGGETFPLPLARRLSQRAPSCKLINHYGPTETTIGCLTFSLSEGKPDDWSRSVPVGRPLPGSRAYILNDDLMPVPVGATGHVHIAGDGLARGYLMAPDLTAEKFIPDPFGPPGTRMYRTGDLMRQTYDGDFEFLGRLDRQVKINGYRIETGEVEAMLARHEAIHQVAVSAQQRQPQGIRLVAYYVTRPDAVVTTSELQRHLETHLPPDLIPSHLVQVEAMPLTHNGKLDLKALQAADVNGFEPGESYQEPVTAVEKQIAQIWQDVLGLSRIGLYDRFFALGGHSLQATQVVAWIRSIYNVDLTLTAFFENPTVAGLVDQIAGLWGGREAVEQFAHLMAQRRAVGEGVPEHVRERDRRPPQ